MSQENVEVVRRWLSLWDGVDPAAVARDDAAWMRYMRRGRRSSPPIVSLPGLHSASGPRRPVWTKRASSGSTGTSPGRASASKSTSSFRSGQSARAGADARPDGRDAARGRIARRRGPPRAGRASGARRVLRKSCRSPQSPWAAGVGDVASERGAVRQLVEPFNRREVAGASIARGPSVRPSAS
jgi:hypothetical protein